MKEFATVLDELQARTPDDPVLSKVLQEVWQILFSLPATARLNELTLCTFDPEMASGQLRDSKYFTRGCLALRDEKLVVVNERFMLELEAAIRSFASAESLLGIPQLQGDDLMFGWVMRVTGGLPVMLSRLRRQAARDQSRETEAAARSQLRLVVLFFLSHELGHVLGGHPTAEYAAFVDPAVPLEQRLDLAVTKLCRHVDEFAREHFTLPGFDQVDDPEGDVRGPEREYRKRDVRSDALSRMFFDNEVAADEWAVRILLEYLTSLSNVGPNESERALHAFARGLFASTMFAWYRDLGVFASKLTKRILQDVRGLMIEMMKAREQYVHAASLFGEFHRFTFLRAVLGLRKVLEARTTWFGLPAESRSIWPRHTAAEISVDAGARRDWWLCESLQCFWLLSISMDTAVKIAYVGCATGWMLDVDRRRGTPQLFAMQFESIAHAVQRLRRFA